MKRRVAAGLTLAALVALTVFGAQKGRNWAAVGGGPGDMKYSPLTQITPQNVANLKQAWTYDLGVSWRAERMEFTPLVVNNVMYFPVPNGTVIALRADTGSLIWKFNLRKVTPTGNASQRGISYWPGAGQIPPRIVLATSDGLLVQLDAKTGAVIPKVGVIDLGAGIMDKFKEPYRTGAPPAIYKNLAIIAADTGENGRWGTPGDPRAFNLLTGKQVWRFHVVPRPGEANFGTWGLNGWQDRRCCGTWVPMAVDAVNGLVYVPTGNATDQDFGASRPGSNLYAATILALDANTGKLKWYFQIAHHDIYDEDVNSPPTLFDVVKDGQRIPAIAQMTKMGFVFILNRLTGKPIFGVQERPVPNTDALGDQAWPTQPFPVKPVPLARDSMSRNEIAYLSSASHKYCQALYDKSVNMGPFTPYMMVPSLVFPSSEGGGGWGGVAFDPGRGLIFANVRNAGLIAQLQPFTSNGVLPSYTKAKIPGLYYVDQDGYPCNKPPWAELYAINANTGDIVWQVPLGDYKQLTARGVPQTGTPTDEGAPMATATGLVFMGGTADQTFRAFDSETGKVLWSASLPEDALTTPLSYEGANSYQYVAILASGGQPEWDLPKSNQEPKDAEIMAFALPGATKGHPIENASASAPKPAANAVPKSPGEALVERACTQCHGLATVTAAGRTRAGWENILQQMIAQGARVTPSEASTIIDYLSRAYPPRKAP
jgi:glucose dehydrogenase